MVNEQYRRNIYIVTTVCIILFGFLVRLKLFLDNPSFWFDESALGFNVTQLSYGKLFGILHLQQVAPPLFLVTSKFITDIFGISDMALHLIPFAIGSLSMVIFLLTLRQLFENKLTIITGLILFCFNTQLIKYSVEFKPYILEVFTTCLLLYVFNRFNFNWSDKKLFTTGIFLAVLPWFSFVSAILIGIYFIIIFSKKYFKKWIITVFPYCISALFILIYYLQIKHFYSGFMLDFFTNDFFNIKEFLIQLTVCFSYLFGINYAFIPLILFLTSIILCLKEKKYVLLSVFSLISFIIFVILSFLKIYPFYGRFTIFIYPIFLIMNLILVNKCFNTQKIFPKFIASFYIIFLLFPTFLYFQKIQAEAYTKRSCARELTSDMASKIKPDDIIIVDTLSTPDFLYYGMLYNFKNKVFMNIENKKSVILYKTERSKNLPIEKGKKYWIYTPWSSVVYDDLKYEYLNTCKYGGRILYINGDKQ